MDIGLIIGLIVIVAILVQAFRPKHRTPPEDGPDNWETSGGGGED